MVSEVLLIFCDKTLNFERKEFLPWRVEVGGINSPDINAAKGAAAAATGELRTLLAKMTADTSTADLTVFAAALAKEPVARSYLATITAPREDQAATAASAAATAATALTAMETTPTAARSSLAAVMFTK